MSTKRILVGISIFALSVIVFIAYPSTDKTINAGQSITSQGAAALTNIHGVTISSDDVLIHYFGKDVVEKTMNQPGCVGVRTYYGKRSDGKSGFVIVGVDKYGTDMKSYATTPGGTKVCPPNCGG